MSAPNEDLQRVLSIINPTQPLNLNSPELQVLQDSNHSVIFRILWIATMICSGCVCCYQVRDRIQVYFQYPVAIDIHINQLTSPGFLDLTFCSAENDYLEENLDLEKHISFVVACMFPIIALLHQMTNFSADAMWNYDTLTNSIEDVKIKTRVLNDITLTIEKSVFGQCTTLKLSSLTKEDLAERLIIRLKKGKSCKTSFILGFLNAKTNRRVGFFIESAALIHLIVKFRRYNYVNTPINKCVDQTTFDVCYKKCINHMLKKSKCRLPVFDDNIKLPECTHLDDIKKSYQQALLINAEPDLFGECGCTRACDLISHSVQTETTKLQDDESILTVGTEDTVLLLKERLAYDVINLLTDIGGSIGLFLGFCVLSFLNIFYVGIFWIHKKYSRRELIQELLVKKYKDYVTHLTELAKEANVQLNSTTNFQKILKYSISSTCVVLALFLIQDRIQYFFEYPVNIIVEVEAKQRVIFPSVTICGISKQMSFTMKRFAKKNNISDWCDVDLLDLLNSSEGFTLDKVWSTTLWSHVTLMTESFERIMQLEMMKANTTEIKTHVGTCTHYKFSVQNYTGVLLLFYTIHPGTGSLECSKKNYAQMYFDDFGSDYYDVFSELESPLILVPVLDFEVKTYEKLNRPYHPCTKKQIYQRCVENCTTDLVQKSQLCRLPFLHKYANLTDCETVAEAKESRQKYLSILSRAKISNLCKCTFPCADSFVLINSEYKITVYPHVFEIYLKMHNNIVEHIIEKQKYPTIALFCDFGNCLGISMGMSALMVVKNTIQLLNVVKTKLFQKNKN